MHMRALRSLLLALLICLPGMLSAFPAAATHEPMVNEGDNHVHDPSMIKQGHTYYLFGTGGGLQIRTSTNLINWTYQGYVFDSIPGWITTAVGPLEDLWAPDISYWNGLYHLYYAGSQFGTNDSVIGLATNVSLDMKSPRYHWVDRGLVLRSSDADDWNAIDPNLTFDAKGRPWLAFGSFWSGIKLRSIDMATGKLSTKDTTRYPLAARPGNTAIEAAFIIYRKPYYYLFVSIDFCCRGVHSTYKTAVGRAQAITGPYVDRAGFHMNQGAAEILLTSHGPYIGPGGQSVVKDGARYLLVHHYYDGNDSGISKVQINPLQWTSDGWPRVEPPLAP
jgi:arabinan endo-1,5-alpha-L-arabinosidase